MKITGYRLQHAIRELGHTLSIVSSQWKESLWAFEGDNKPSPRALMEKFRDTEDKISQLQTLQARYNLAVNVNVLGDQMTLAEAVKRVGGAGRAEKMWRSAAGDTGRDRYHGRDMTRNTDEIRATRQISVKKAMNYAKIAARYASALREAIQVANATEIEFDLDPTLFE